MLIGDAGELWRTGCVASGREEGLGSWTPRDGLGCGRSLTRGVRPGSARRPQLQGIAAGATADADFEEVAAGDGEAEGTVGGENGPRIRAQIPGQGLLGIADEEIEITDPGVADGEGAVAGTAGWHVDGVEIGAIRRSLFPEGDLSRRVHPAEGSAVEGQSREIGLRIAAGGEATVAGGPGLRGDSGGGKGRLFVWQLGLIGEYGASIQQGPCRR